MHLWYHRLANREYRHEVRSYLRVSRSLADRLVAAVNDAEAEIRHFPAIGSPHLKGTRLWRVNRFPFHMIYYQRASGLEIVAFVYNRRKPGYWMRRLP